MILELGSGHQNYPLSPFHVDKVVYIKPTLNAEHIQSSLTFYPDVSSQQPYVMHFNEFSTIYCVLGILRTSSLHVHFSTRDSQIDE